VAAGVALLQAIHESVIALEQRSLLERFKQRGLSQIARDRVAPIDFVRKFRPAPSMAEVMRSLQRSADDHDVRVARIQSDPHERTASELGQAGVALTLDGTYPAIVSVLRELLDQYPAATLRKIDIERAPPVAQSAAALATTPPIAASTAAAAGQTQAEAHVTLSFWSQPLDIAAPPLAAQISTLPASEPEAAGASTTRNH